MSRAVMQQALEVLEYIHTETSAYEDGLIHAAITALRAALAEPEQEPVAWVLVTPYGEEDDIFYTEPETVPDGWSYKPLYDTAPTPRKPLSEDEIVRLMVGEDRAKLLSAGEFAEGAVRELVESGRAIERAHGIGEQDGS